MKKYTQPTVEITAFDFEDIICESSGQGTVANKSYAESGFNAANYSDAVEINVAW